MKLPMQKHTHQQVPGRPEFLFFLWMLQRLSLCMYTSFYAVSRGKTQDRLCLCIYNSSYAVSRDRTQDQLQVLFVDSVLWCRKGVLFLEVWYMSLSNGSDGSLSMKFIFSSNCNVWTMFFLCTAPLTASFGVHIHSTTRTWFRANAQ